MITALLLTLYVLPIVAVFALLAWVADTIEVWEKRK
jgi:preprotein translocase subunit SecE